MAPELEMGMGAGTGMGYAIDPFSFSSHSSAATATTANAYKYGLPSSSADAMHVDDLLNFSGQPTFFEPAPAAPNPQHYQQHFPHPGPPAATTEVSAFPFDLRIPGEEEEAELEWLSRFVEDSFSGMPFPSPGMGNGAVVSNNNNNIGNSISNNDNNPSIHYNMDTRNYQVMDQSAAAVVLPGRPRTKRARPVAGNAPAVSAAWSALPPPPSPSSSSSSSSDTRPRGARKEKEAAENGGGVRKCTHCASEKTPQWRTGPLGPKTLCNACGVRYKSGRLVPEYRPAASPTFVLTQHSNSHRKVMELRRQKELLLRHQQAAAFVAAGTPAGSAATATAPRPDMLLRDYEVC